MTTELQARLHDLAATLDVPSAPDLAATLKSRLPERRPARLRRARRTLSLAFALALLAAGTAMAVPSSRDAILQVLGLRGVRIEHVQTLPPLPASSGHKLGLGRRIPLRRARHAAGFTALLPPSATAAYLARDVAGGRISLIVGPALVIEFRGTVAPLLLKLLPPGAGGRRLDVNGGPGVYLFGAQHEVFFETSNGTFGTDRVRLAGNVLIWQQGPLTVRIEGTHTLAQAVALARSLR